MRPSLLPGLLGAARRNLARGATSLRLFEIGPLSARCPWRGGRKADAGVVLAGERPRAAGRMARPSL
jgi:phenylalanyl-tRNA synthetase beta chain